MQTVPKPEEGPTVSKNMLVGGVVNLSAKVVQVLVATTALLEPSALAPRDVPVFFFMEEATVAGVLGWELLIRSVRPCDVVVKSRFFN